MINDIEGGAHPGEVLTQCGWLNTRPTWWLLYAPVAVVGLAEAFIDGERLRQTLQAATVMLTSLTVRVPYLTALGRAALAAQPWVQRISLR